MKDKVFDWFESHSLGSQHREPGSACRWCARSSSCTAEPLSIDSAVGQGTNCGMHVPIERVVERTAAE